MKLKYSRLLLKNKVIIPFLLLIILSGCANFYEKLQPDQIKWALAHGNTTVTIRGYVIDKHKDVYQCGKRSIKAVLMPDDPYFQEMIHVIRTSSYFWHKKLSKESKQFLRFAQKNGICTFTFNNVPSGKWIVIIDLWYFLQTESLQAGNVIFTKKYPVPDLTYVPLTIKTQDTIIQKNIIMDFNKRTDIGFFKQRKKISLGEISNWENPPKLSEKILTYGLNKQ